jgi:hypothetical protein
MLVTGASPIIKDEDEPAVAITLKDFQAFAQDRISEGIAHPEQLHDRVEEVLDFAVANESSMDAEANAYLSNLMDTIASLYERAMGNLADSPDKRKILRSIAVVRRKHHKAETFLKRLGMPYPVPIPIVEAARPIFLDAQQSVLDLLWDATQQSQQGAAQFATLGLFYWTVDELTAAFYLAERRYTTQAYGHLRTVHDLLEKAELFFHQPTWADVWASGDKKKIRVELSPGAIRRKLGRPKFDPVYGFFTELGTHGTWEALRKRVTQTGKKEDRAQVAMRIGGTPWDSEVEMAVGGCIFTVFSTLLSIAMVYDARLHRREVAAILRARFEQAREFLHEHFLEPRKRKGIDTSALTETLRKLTLGLEAIESAVKVSN